jgi:type IV pilus assembly protein PilA
MNIEKLKKSKKGFTLVEIIVVLVIIAILAAIAIPAMVGWIDKANEKAVYAEARTTLLAAQTLASEWYGTKSVAFDDAAVNKALVAELAEVDVAHVTSYTVSGGAITDLIYTNKYKATYDSDGTKRWVVE